MDPSSGQHHHQEMSSQTLESMLVCTKAQQEKKPRPAEQALKCPRCDSTNTKFCYYNNYSLTQPRYFCKSCRRYWTKGGTLRNVPVGGGCRKNKRSSSSSSSSSSKRSHDQALTNNSTNSMLSSLTTPLSYDHHHHHSSDLSLAIARLQKQASAKMGFDNENNHEFNHHFDHGLGNPSLHSSPAGHGLFDALRNGFLESTPNGFHSFNNYFGNIGNMGQVENGCGGLGINVSEEMATMPYEDQLIGATTATTSTTTIPAVKQEMICNARENENRVLWGFPWQIGGDVNMAADHLDSSGRQSWNGFGSTWHGLVNGPLM